MKVSSILFDCARRSNTGSLDLVLAEQYLQNDEWGEAVRSIQKALKKASADKTGKAYLLLGHAHLKQGQVKMARSAFIEAAWFPQYRAQAKYWLDKLTLNPEIY